MTRLTQFPTLFEDRGLDDFFEGFFRPIRHEFEGEHLVPAMDVRETDKELLVKAEMPGIKKEDIEVSLQNGILTIRGETEEKSEEKEGEEIIRQERRYGKYVRSMTIGSHIDESHVEANYKDGVLELRIPKTEVVEPKKIKVDVH